MKQNMILSDLRLRKAIVLPPIIVLLLLAGTLGSRAQSGGDYELTWSTIDSGGGASIGGYTLMGTIGQSDAGALGGGGYTLVGGLWGGAMAQYKIYLPLVLRL